MSWGSWRILHFSSIVLNMSEMGLYDTQGNRLYQWMGDPSFCAQGGERTESGLLPALDSR